MRITPNELKEFKQIYFKEFGVWLEDSEAMEKALNLLTGIEMVLKGSTKVSSVVLTKQKN